MGNIYLEKPDIGELRKKGYTIVDMHVHSRHSCDCFVGVKGIIKRAKKLGIGVAITDHNMIEGSIEAEKLGRSNGVLVIPGIEARSTEGIDILIYFYKIGDLIGFYNKHLKPNKKWNIQGSSKLSIEEITRILKRYKCIVCIAHPYRFYLKKVYNVLLKKKRNKKLFRLFKVIEVVNGKNLERKNKKAIKKARQLEKYYIGGSDSHRLKDIGMTVTCSKNSNSVKKFLDNISHSRNVTVVGEETRMPYRLVRPLVSIKNAVSHKIRGI
jgi:predicted metal-dependent phosphoesterase TrpH|tara:strand:+ start:147 stop:950 length:804 start_codon:yes stop_codon:yes gene_type:complete